MTCASCWLRFRFAALAILLFANVARATTDVTALPGAVGDSAASGPLAEIWGRDSLAGRWDGLRDRLANGGIVLGADTIDEIVADTSGGTQTGAYYEGRLEVLATIDLEKTLGWSGATLHANAYWTHGMGASAGSLDNNLMTVSNIEAAPSIRLFDLWLEQSLFDGRFSIRAGQIAADDEFIISAGASHFSNGTFGWPTIVSADLPSGGPAYPLATPGIRVKFAQSENLLFRAALFNGDPAEPGPGDPQRRDDNGLAFRLDGGALAIGEADYKSSLAFGSGDLPSTYKFGAWFHSGDFADVHLDNTGRSLASPTSSGVAAEHRGDCGVYGVVDQTVWHKPDTQDDGVAIFLRGSWAPSDRNPVVLYGDAGVTLKGLIDDRPNDILGIAFAIAKISDDVQALDRDVRRFSGIAVPVHDYEATLELTYHVQINQRWSVQPDLQFVVHPGGNIALPPGIAPIPNATVMGLRSSIVL
jgi:porin